MRCWAKQSLAAHARQTSLSYSALNRHVLQILHLHFSDSAISGTSYTIQTNKQSAQIKSEKIIFIKTSALHTHCLSFSNELHISSANCGPCCYLLRNMHKVNMGVLQIKTAFKFPKSIGDELFLILLPILAAWFCARHSLIHFQRTLPLVY